MKKLKITVEGEWIATFPIEKMDEAILFCKRFLPHSRPNIELMAAWQPNVEANTEWLISQLPKEIKVKYTYGIEDSIIELPNEVAIEFDYSAYIHKETKEDTLHIFSVSLSKMPFENERLINEIQKRLTL